MVVNIEMISFKWLVPSYHPEGSLSTARRKFSENGKTPEKGAEKPDFLRKSI